MDTPLVCHAYSPGTPDNPMDVLDVVTSGGKVRLTIRREGKLLMNRCWEEEDDGRSMAQAMVDQLASSFRPPTPEELRTIPDLMTSIESAQPEDARLCIQWDIDGRSVDQALELRNQVMEVAETLLDEAELLIDWDGASVGAETVEVTFSVVDFNAAESLLLEKLSANQKAYNCTIFNEVTD